MSESDFALALDVGNSRVTAAVVYDARDATDNPVLFRLSGETDSASSAVFVDGGGALFFGDTAEEMGSAAPERLIREFAHDVGDDVPLVVGEHAVTADDLFARVCGWIVDEVTTAEGARPALIAVTHPASWGGHRLARMRAALARTGIEEPLLVSESEASATNLDTSHPMETGQLLAVYDLGGTRFDARVLRRRSGGRFQPVGEQVTIEHLGGANFDDALLRHVTIGTALDDDDASWLAIARARRGTVRAKELLSAAGDATVQLALPPGPASVRVTRSEFESMIDADLERTVEALDLAIESAGTQADRVEAILLTGGSSRIPLVAQRLSERFDLPIIADTDPQASTVLGAARIARERLHRVEAAPGTAIATLTNAEKIPAPKPAPASERSGVLAFLRPLIGKPSRSTSPLLLAGAAVFIAITIVFSSTTAAGTRWPDHVQEAASNLLNLPRPTGLSLLTKPPAPPAAVPNDEKATNPVNRANPGSEDSDAAPARKSSRTPTASSPAALQSSGGGGPKAEPTSPPTAPPSGTATDTSPAAPAAETDDTTTDTTAPPEPTIPPEPETPPADTTPPVDTPPADPVPTEPTAPETTTPVDPPATDQTTSSEATLADPPVVEPAPESTPGPAPEPV